MVDREKFQDWTYRSARVLTYLYHEQSWNQEQIADEFGVTKPTISRWMSETGVEADYETLNALGEDEIRRLYWDQGETQKEIAERVGSNQANVSRYMKEHSIEARDASHTPATFFTDSNGYEYWYSNTDGCRVPSHRLLALMEFTLDEIASNDIHHKNGVPWDNRVENLEPLSRSEHARLHQRADT